MQEADTFLLSENQKPLLLTSFFIPKRRKTNIWTDNQKKCMDTSSRVLNKMHGSKGDSRLHFFFKEQTAGIPTDELKV